MLKYHKNYTLHWYARHHPKLPFPFGCRFLGFVISLLSRIWPAPKFVIAPRSCYSIRLRVLPARKLKWLSQIFVLYAGSRGNLMETDVGPSFSRATGYKYSGRAKGSVLSANLTKEKLRTPDVFRHPLSQRGCRA